MGKGAQGEETLYMLQRRGSSMRVAPKGAGKRGAPRKIPGGGSQGKGSKWDPKGCARCGRSSHWAREYTATTDVNGEAPKGKPNRPKPKKGKGKGRLNELEEEDGTAGGEEGEGEADALFEESEEEGHMFVLEEEDEMFTPDPWVWSDPWLRPRARKTISPKKLALSRTAVCAPMWHDSVLQWVAIR